MKILPIVALASLGALSACLPEGPIQYVEQDASVPPDGDVPPEDAMPPPGDGGLFTFCHGGNRNCQGITLPTRAVRRSSTTTLANYDCPSYTEKTTTNAQAVTVSGRTLDFGTSAAEGGVEVRAFASMVYNNQIAQTTSSATGEYSVTIPAGNTNRTFWKVSKQGFVDTYAANLWMNFSGTTFTADRRILVESQARIVSNNLGENFDEIRKFGTVVGNIYQCGGDESNNDSARAGNRVRHAIAFISSSSGARHFGPTITGSTANSKVYYFEGNLPDPDPKETQAAGQFLAVRVPVSATPRVYVQAWGFLTEADVGMGAEGLSLLSEVQVPGIREAIFSVDMPPTGR